jgi:hypothetical protein
VLIYVNGKLEAFKPYTNPAVVGNLPLFFGSTGNPYFDAFFNGALDDVRIYDRALNVSEIKNIFSEAVLTGCSSNPIVPRCPEGLTCQSGVCKVPAPVAPPKLILNLFDAASFGKYSSIEKQGDAAFEQYSGKNVALFDGNGDYLKIASSLVPFSGNSFSVGGWFNAKSLTNGANEITGTYLLKENSFILHPMKDGSMRLYIKIGGTWQAIYAPTEKNIVLNEWEYWVGTFDGATLKLYKNGVLVQSKALSGSAGTSGDWYIGHYEQLTLNNRYLRGMASGVFYSPSVLEESEILQTYRNGKDYYASLSSSIYDIFIARTLLKTPGNINVELLPRLKIKVSWKDLSSNEDSFIIFKSLYENGPWVEKARVLQGQESYEDSDVFPSLTYYYKVRAYNVGVGYSPDSSAKNVFAYDYLPSINAQSGVVGGRNGLMWDKSQVDSILGGSR